MTGRNRCRGESGDWQNPSGVKRDARRRPSMPLPRYVAAAFAILALPLWMGCSARPQPAGTQPAM